MDTSSSNRDLITDTSTSTEYPEGLWSKPLRFIPRDVDPFGLNPRYVAMTIKTEPLTVDMEKFKKLFDNYKMTKERLETSVENGWGDAVPGDKEWFGESKYELMKFIEENVYTIFELLNKK